MKWLVKLFYYGRLKRLERIGEAAALLAAGRTEDAEARLESARPRRWVEDLAVYHFVMGKLRMEQGALEEAERHLQAALALGLERPSVKLNLAVLKVRCCDLGAALALLSEVELSDNEDILEQARVMRDVISKVSDGSFLSEIAERSARFRKKHLTKIAAEDSVGSAEHVDSILSAISSALREGKLSTKDLEDATLLYGSLLVDRLGGHWLLGLEPQDYRVLLGGVAYHPSRDIARVVESESEILSLPTCG